jgi:cell division initiation protein
VTQHDHAFPYYRSPEDIRRQEFSHRMRGLDEYEVQEFLDLLADQVKATEVERAEFRAENERLRAEVEHLRNQHPESSTGEISPQAVALFSQAQQVADQLVEEAVRHARDLMTSARNQQREILQRAHEAADNAVRVSGAVPAESMVGEYTRPVQEIEYVRTFARVAQVQLRSVLEALTEQVDKLGEVPRLTPANASTTGGADKLPAVYQRPTGT